MQFDIWGATNLPRLVLPEHTIIGVFLLLAYLLILGLSFYKRPDDLKSLRTKRTWQYTFLLSFVALLLSQILPADGPNTNQLSLLVTAENPVKWTPFGYIPVLIAGLMLNPVSAMIVAFFSGLGRALWQTAQIYTPLHFALAGLVAGLLLRQNYQQRLYQWLRRPYIVGPLSLLLILPIPIALATYIYTSPAATALATFDFAITTTTSYLVPLLIEGVIAGITLSIFLRGLPQVAAAQQPVSSSQQGGSLKWRLISNFTVFSLGLTFVLLIMVFQLAVHVSTKLVVTQMAHNANTVSNSIPDFFQNRQNLLTQYKNSDILLAEKPRQIIPSQAASQELQRLFRTGPFFRRIMLVRTDGTIFASVPATGVTKITDLEQTALLDAWQTQAPQISTTEAIADEGVSLSFMVPMSNEFILVGRVPELALMELIRGLQGTAGEGQGYIIDATGQIIAHRNRDSLLTFPTLSATSDIEIEGVDGVAYKGRQGNTNTRQLVYYVNDDSHTWTIVVTVPYDVVLGLALQVASPLAGILFAAMLIFLAYLFYLSRTITKPLVELGEVSKEIASGHLNTPITVTGPDEIGQLSRYFQQMQSALKQRMEELSLLLGISQSIAASIDIQQGIPPILQGVIRGTGASGVRMVILNPNGSHPLSFGEGPASEEMSKLDRKAMNLAYTKGEVIALNKREVATILDLDLQPELSIQALILMPLKSRRRFHGVVWVGYRRSRHFTQRELDLLHTLGGQATVVVDNGLLFATAESGRRRLAAVLASTADAVIVTEQTGRILLINPAMEKAFKLNTLEVRGQHVKRVITNDDLLSALTQTSERVRNLEIEGNDNITWAANISTIISADGQAMGRVAVLHDITVLKEVNELKSQFVRTVSHDLRTPLTFIRGYTNMLPMTGSLTEKQNEYVKKIERGVNQMEELVNNVLDFRRIEEGLELAMQDLDVRQLLQGIVFDYEDAANEVGLNLILDVPAKLPIVRGDATILRQAIANFVGNALKYAPNSGDLVVSARIEPQPKTGRQMIVIRVKDNGPGIPAKDIEHLFEPFYRIKERKTERIKGSGLGLAIVRSVAERHGGNSWCESKLGEGSTFLISLPVKDN